MKFAPIFVGLILFFHAFEAKCQEYRVLDLRSGGATGVVSATVLEELEKQIGQPVYKIFDRIFSTSIGAIMAALLTVPNQEHGEEHREEHGEPRSAKEVADFIEKAFLSYGSAIRVNQTFRQMMPEDIQFRQTLIPVSVVSAQVLNWGWMTPQRAKIKIFDPKSHGCCSLASVVCGSCTVPLLHSVELISGGGQQSHCIDSGLSCVIPPEIHPTVDLLNQFATTLNPEQDSITLVSISNGRPFQPEYQVKEGRAILEGYYEKIPLKVILLEGALSDALNQWSIESRVCRVKRKILGDERILGQASVGSIPARYLRELAKTMIASDAFQELLGSLRSRVTTDEVLE